MYDCLCALVCLFVCVSVQREELYAALEDGDAEIHRLMERVDTLESQLQAATDDSPSGSQSPKSGRRPSLSRSSSKRERRTSLTGESPLENGDGASDSSESESPLHPRLERRKSLTRRGSLSRENVARLDSSNFEEEANAVTEVRTGLLLHSRICWTLHDSQFFPVV